MMSDMPRLLKDLLAAWAAAVRDTDHPQPPAYDGPDVALTGFTEKTSEVAPGMAFVARVRTGSDGHPYIAQAISRGASLILAQRPAAALGLSVPAGVAYLTVPDTAEALAWLLAAWEGFPSRQLVVIGITGTDGKTTTANILFNVLRAAGIRAGLLSTIKAVIGDTEEPLELHVTTPESPVVQRYLRRMFDAGLTHCVLETTSHALAQQRVAAVDFDLAVVTNITHEHLDYHGSHEAYFAAKRRLFGYLLEEIIHVPSGNAAKVELRRAAVLNRDDRSFGPLAEFLVGRAVDVVAYGVREIEDGRRLTADGEASDEGERGGLSGGLSGGFQPTAGKQSALKRTERAAGDSETGFNRVLFGGRGFEPAAGGGGGIPSRPTTATEIEYGPEATAFMLHVGGVSLPVNAPLPGAFNVHNMLAASAAALALGVGPEAIRAGLEGVPALSGRMERIDRGQPFLVVVDFAHTPNALARAIEAARGMIEEQGSGGAGAQGRKEITNYELGMTNEERASPATRHPMPATPRVLAVFGSAGKRDVAKRRLMAEVAARAADLTVLTAEDPRTESLDDILATMADAAKAAGGVEGQTFWRVPDRGRAIYFALTLVRPGDVVLLCGKGHEQSMAFGTVEYPWDDRRAAEAALAAFLEGREMVDLGLPTFGE